MERSKNRFQSEDDAKKEAIKDLKKLFESHLD